MVVSYVVVDAYMRNNTFTSEAEKGISPDKIKDIAINASDKVYEQDDLGPIQSVKNSLSYILTQITQIAQFLQDNEYEIATAYRSEEKVCFTIMTCFIIERFFFSQPHLFICGHKLYVKS